MSSRFVWFSAALSLSYCLIASTSAFAVDFEALKTPATWQYQGKDEFQVPTKVSYQRDGSAKTVMLHIRFGLLSTGSNLKSVKTECMFGPVPYNTVKEASSSDESGLRELSAVWGFETVGECVGLQLNVKGSVNWSLHTKNGTRQSYGNHEVVHFSIGHQDSDDPAYRFAYSAFRAKPADRGGIATVDSELTTLLFPIQIGFNKRKPNLIGAGSRQLDVAFSLPYIDQSQGFPVVTTESCLMIDEPYSKHPNGLDLNWRTDYFFTNTRLICGAFELQVQGRVRYGFSSDMVLPEDRVDEDLEVDVYARLAVDRRQQISFGLGTKERLVGDRSKLIPVAMRLALVGLFGRQVVGSARDLRE